MHEFMIFRVGIGECEYAWLNIWHFVMVHMSVGTDGRIYYTYFVMQYLTAGKNGRI